MQACDGDHLQVLEIGGRMGVINRHDAYGDLAGHGLADLKGTEGGSELCLGEDKKHPLCLDELLDDGRLPGLPTSYRIPTEEEGTARDSA